MDFEKLLRVARKNELNKKEPVKCLQTKFKPPTKEQHERDKVLSEGVQRFLARKEEEEKKKQLEAERRKKELLALRAKDPKANKRIQTMLKRTKSANKSVMEDAVDNNNTADTLAGPSQPDEDDYGFVSESSSQLYNKLIQKMYSTPSEDLPKFAPMKKPNSNNLSNTKERVKMALLRQEEEDKLPHKRKRKGKEKKDDEDDDGEEDLHYGAPDRNVSSVSVDQTKEKPKVKKLPPPPPVDFHELLKIAEKKQHEPVVLEPKKPQEPEVLMTKKQKIEYEKMQEWKRQRDLRLQCLEKGGKWNPQDDKKDEKKPIPRIPKLGQTDSDQKATAGASQKKVTESETAKVKSQEKSSSPAAGQHKKIPKTVPSSQNVPDKKAATQKKNVDEETSRLIRERDEALRVLKEKEKLIRERDEAMRRLKEREQLIKERDEALRKLKLLEESEKLRDSSSTADNAATKQGSQGQKPKAPVRSSESAKSSPAPNAGSKPQPSGPRKPDSAKPSTNGSSGREFPPRQLKPMAKGSGMPGGVQRSRQFPPADVRRRALALKRRRIESDDEYDSELDDFIDDDDTEVPSEEVSKVISEIFKYDKNKYNDVDDECMESNFARISKEEFFSTKCGILEDLKDIQKEKAKMARKKKR